MTSDTRTADEIERDIEANRRDLSKNIDELQDRISLDGIVREVTDRFRDNGGEIGQAFYNQMRSNPVPLALTGIGLAWMMFAGSAPPRQGPRLPPHSRGRTGPEGSGYRRPEPSDTRSYEGADRGQSWSGRSPSWAGGAYGGPSRHTVDSYGVSRDADQSSRQPAAANAARTGTVSGAAGSAAKSASDMAHQASDATGSAASSVSDGLSAAGSTISDSAHAIGDAISRFGHQISEGTEHLAEDARARVIHARRRAIEASRPVPSMSQSGDIAADYYERQPLVFGALALALGAAIGSAIPRTRTEDAYMGAASDDLYHEAERIFAEEREKAERVASKTMDEVKAVVAEETGKVDSKAPGEKSAADAVKDEAKSAATRIAQTAKDAAEDEKLGKPDA